MSALQGKVVLVTGGARHIGRQIAVACAGAGADIAITYLASRREANATLTRVEAIGRRAAALQCDVRDESATAHAVKRIVKELGRIDVLVNNAAIYESGDFNHISPARWQAMFATNTVGPYLVAQACRRELEKRQGRIVNLGSLGGLRPWVTHAHYCASKAALIMLTQIMAKALAPEIAVNCVAPGMIETDTQSGKVLRRFKVKTPMQSNGSPEDVAAAVLFFATAPKFITGQVLVVDGGLGLLT
jgi:NAD(P)-dependent dehydrogenase (short-subunit alcohol dehydrogenase family)